MTYGSLLLTFFKLPGRIRDWVIKHKLLADLFAGGIVLMILGAISKSIVAIVGAITCGLLVGASLEIVGSKNARKLNDNTKSANR